MKIELTQQEKDAAMAAVAIGVFAELAKYFRCTCARGFFHSLRLCSCTCRECMLWDRHG